MSIEELLREAYRLPRQDKFRLVQELISQLAEAEGIAPGECPIWSPYEAHDGATTLLRML